MVGSIRALVLTALVVAAVIASLVLVGTAVAAPSGYCSNASYWDATDEASYHSDVAHDLFMADEYLDAYGEMLDAKYEISGSVLPCHPKAKQHRRLSLLMYATWATAYKQSYLEHYGEADRAFDKAQGYIKQIQKLLKRMPLTAMG